MRWIREVGCCVILLEKYGAGLCEMWHWFVEEMGTWQAVVV